MTEQEEIKGKVKKALEDLLSATLYIFEKHNEPLGPAFITRELGLFKGLNKETKNLYKFPGANNDRMAQGLINELLNRRKIKRVEKNQLKQDFINKLVEEKKIRRPKKDSSWTGYQYNDS